MAGGFLSACSLWPKHGVVGAAQICVLAGHPEIITFDMGGTSSDVSSCGTASRKSLRAWSWMAGHPGATLDIHTVGAGGGSIAWIDSGEHLRVGPQSAGANPARPATAWASSRP
jgi:N-methylhydantoinase A